jgi:hypothetical protein
LKYMSDYDHAVKNPIKKQFNMELII